MSSYSHLYGSPPSSSPSVVQTPSSAGAARQRRGSFTKYGSQIIHASPNTDTTPSHASFTTTTPPPPVPAFGATSTAFPPPMYGVPPSGYPHYPPGPAGAFGNPYQPSLHQPYAPHPALQPHPIYQQHHPQPYPFHQTMSAFQPSPSPAAAYPHAFATMQLPTNPPPSQAAAAAASSAQQPVQQIVNPRAVSNPTSAPSSRSRARTQSASQSLAVQVPSSSGGVPRTREGAPSPREDEVKVVRLRVVARVRPMLAHETGRTTECVTFPAPRALTLSLPAAPAPVGSAGAAPSTASRSSVESEGSVTSRTFQLDAVLGPSSSQQQVFESSGVRDYLNAALDGYAATVFAYGQTGSVRETNERASMQHASPTRRPSLLPVDTVLTRSLLSLLLLSGQDAYDVRRRHSTRHHVSLLHTRRRRECPSRTRQERIVGPPRELPRGQTELQRMERGGGPHWRRKETNQSTHRGVRFLLSFFSPLLLDLQRAGTRSLESRFRFALVASGG